MSLSRAKSVCYHRLEMTLATTQNSRFSMSVAQGGAWLLALLAACGNVACSSSDGGATPGGGAGAQTTGGAGAQGGASVAGGGSVGGSPSSGGSSSVGGSPSNGGAGSPGIAGSAAGGASGG